MDNTKQRAIKAFNSGGIHTYRVDGPKTFSVVKATFKRSEWVRRQLRKVPYETQRKGLLTFIKSLGTACKHTINRFLTRRRAIKQFMSENPGFDGVSFVAPYKNK